jgi:hypothetical protein
VAAFGHCGASCGSLQALWCTLASLKGNVRFMLAFLMDMGMAAGQQVRVFLVVQDGGLVGLLNFYHIVRLSLPSGTALV